MFLFSDDPLFTDEELFLMCAASGGKTVQDTATGNPLVFTTDLARPLKSLLIPFTPQQEGTGDPSPQNIRPITGWDAVNAGHGGKNLLNPASFYDGVTVADGQYTFDRSGYTANLMTGQSGGDHVVNDIQKCPVLPAGNYVFSTKVISGGVFASVYKVSDEGVRTGVSSGAVTDGDYRYTLFTLDEPSRICICRSSNTNPSVFAEPQIESGTQRTAYEPYHPITETDISFPSLVYGGTLDVVSGVLTVEWVAYKLKDINLMYQQEHGRFRFDLTEKSAGEVGKWSNIAIAEAYKSSSTMAGQTASIITYSNNYIFIIDTRYTDVPSLIENMGETIIAYPLATPQEIQLTPAQITALVGDNTIWSDADGEMTAVYLKKG